MANQEGHEGNKIQTGVFSQSSTPSPPITELGLFTPRRQSSSPERLVSLLEAVEVEDSNTSKKTGAEGRAADSNGFPESGTTIGEKIGELYDKKGLYSDVQFIVGHSSSCEQPSTSSASQSQTSTSSMERRATHHEVETIPAHKLILSLATPVFASMFFSDLAESSSSAKIRVPDCTPSAFKIALQFIYKGKESNSAVGAGAELDIEEFADILYVARKYCLVGLEEEVLDILQAKLSPSTLRQILRIVEFYELSVLGGKCWAFIQRNTWEFLKECTTEKLSSEGGSSSRLEKGILALILDLEAVNATEVQHFEQLVKWAKLECTERELDEENPAVVNGVIRDMLHLIQFPTMTGAEFPDAVVPTGLLSTAPADSIFINGENKKREEEELSEVSTIPRTVHNNINSLDQDLILRLVLEHVGKGSETDLKNCRLVNHSWNRVAVQVLEEQHRYALALDSKNLDEFKNLLWRTQLSKLRSKYRELESLRLSFNLNSFITSESGTVEFVVGGASEMGKAGQILQLNPHLRVAFIDYGCDVKNKSECDQEQTRMVLVNQELFNLLKLTSATLQSIVIGYEDFVLRPHFEEFEFDSSLTFPNLTFLKYRANPTKNRMEGYEMLDLTKHVLSIIQGAPKLTKLSVHLWDCYRHLKSSINSLHAIMKGCADRIEELELEVETDQKELDVFKALSGIKFPALGLLKIIDGFYYPNKWLNLFLKNSCPVLDRLQVRWSCVYRDEDEPMLLEFPTLPNIIHFSFDPFYCTYLGWPEYFDYTNATFSTLMMGLPSLKSFNFSINLLFVLGVHLKKSGNAAPSPAIYPVFPNISTLEITADDDADSDEDWSTTDLLAMTALVYHHTFPNVRKLVIKPRICGSTSMERVGSVLEHLCSYGIQTLEIHDYVNPWLDHLSNANHGFQGLKSLKLFAPKTGKGPWVDPVQLLTRFPALEFLQFGKQMVSANQIQSFRDMLKIFEDPLSN